MRLVAIVRLLARRAIAALKEWSGPLTNPFLQRALRTESRRNKPFFTVLGIALFACILNCSAWWLWLRFISNNQKFGGRFGHLTDPSQLPEAIGGNPMGLVALMTSFACAVGVIVACRSRSAFLLRQELLKSTLDGLHQLPIAEERWLWMMSAHPTALALLVWLMGLPVYAIVWSIGQWTVFDILGLLVLFILMGHAAPVWKPLVWQQQTLRKSGQRFNWKEWQETLKTAQLEAKLAGADDAIDPLERQRRLQRSLSGAAREGSPAQHTTAEQQPEAEAKKSKAAASSTWGSMGGAKTGGGVIAWIFFQAALSSLGPIFSGAGGTYGAIRQYVEQALPTSVITLLPGFVVTWPLMLARLLMAPLPFFAFALPPVLLVIPIWLGISHQNFANLAGAVSPVETFWTASRRRQRNAVAIILWIGFLLIIFGYSWPYLIKGGELAKLLPGAPPGISSALGAAWTIAIVLGTLLAGVTLEVPFKQATEDSLPQARAWKNAARCAALSLAGAVGLYLLFCLLGGTLVFDAAWGLRLLQTTAVAGAFLLAVFGSAALGATLPPLARLGWRPLRMMWFYGLALLALALLARAKSVDASFPHVTAAAVYLSPFTTLLSLFRSDLSTPIQMWHGVAAQAVLGSTCLILAAYLAFAHQAAEADGSMGEAPSRWVARMLTLLTAPFRWLAWLFRTIASAVLSCFDYLGKLLAGWNDAILRRGMRYDNAVLSAELRRRLRREHWPLQWLAVAVVTIGAYSLIGTQQYLSVPSATSSRDWVHDSIYTILVVSWALACLSASGLGQSFDRERLNGTTVFLFLTPMTDAAILLGKFIPSVLYTVGFLLSALPILLVGCTIALLLGMLPIIAVALGGAILTVSALLFSACIQLLFGVRAVKPTEGTTKAILWQLAIELFSWGLLLACNTQGVWGLVAGLALLTIVHLGLALACWHLALWSMRRQRYGDVTAGGKAAG